MCASPDRFIVCSSYLPANSSKTLSSYIPAVERTFVGIALKGLKVTTKLGLVAISDYLNKGFYNSYDSMFLQ